MVTQGVEHELGPLESLDGFVQVAGQVAYAGLVALSDAPSPDRVRAKRRPVTFQ